MGISSRDKILNTIKRGIYKPGDEKADAPDSIFHKEVDLHNYRRETQTPRNLLVQESENLIENFINELSKVNGTAKVMNNEDQIKEYLSSLTAESNSKSFLVWETALIKQLKVIEYLETDGLRIIKSHDKEQLAKADIGITEADYAIADSGTLVLFSNPNKPRLVSLIAPLHIAILESKKIVHNIFQLFQIVKHEYHQEMRGKDPMRCLTFITGPSRTADIELNLTLGVHGPKEVHVLIYNK